MSANEKKGVWLFGKFYPNLSEDDLWDGPTPTIEQRRETWEWMIEFFQQFPESGLKDDYPHLHKIAMATKRYKELELLKSFGRITEDEYQSELEKILPLVNIADDFDPNYDSTKE